MERLPKRFEDEILRKNCVKWNGRYYSDTVKDVYITRYHIAAIGLEAMMKVGFNCVKDMYGYRFISAIWEFENQDLRVKDFCECTFKAIREVYGDG